MFHSPDLAAETRWSEYLQEVQDAGVRSIMAVPLDLAGEAVGALDRYAEAPHAFDDEPGTLCLSYAAQAADSIRLAVRIGCTTSSSSCSGFPPRSGPAFPRGPGPNGGPAGPVP